MNFGFRMCLFCLCFTIAQCIPERGDLAWTMLLCKFRGNDYIPHEKEWYVKWVTDDSVDGSIAYFFRKASNGIYTIGQSRVHGWFELPFTKEEVINLANKDERLLSLLDPPRRTYVKTKQLCYEYAVSILKIEVPSLRRLITVINDEDTAVYCIAYGVLVAPRFMMTAAVVHEMAHSFNLGHSYSDVRTKVFSHAEPGEYDDRYDLMSTANAHMYTSADFGVVGPGFNGPTLDYLGWLPAYRLYLFGTQDSDRGPTFETAVRLSSLSRSHRSTADWLLIVIPYDRDDPQKVYTVELRTREILDAGIPNAAILIHQISRRDNGVFLYSKILNQGGTGPAYELREGGEWTVQLEEKFGNQFIRVKVNWIDEKSATAQVVVFSSFSPTACAKGEVQRAAFEFDIPCVSVRERQEIRRQNERHARGTTVTKNGQCRFGFVERKAGPDDHVCVNEFERALVQKQNERWQGYRDFYSNPTFGLNACQRGYVWRQMDSYDYVCVEESRKNELTKQDELHEIRKLHSTNACADGFVSRQALSFDEICVTAQERSAVEADNEKRIERLVYQRFFNADNKVVA